MAGVREGGGWRVGREGATSSKGSRASVSLGVSFLEVWEATAGDDAFQCID